MEPVFRQRRLTSVLFVLGAAILTLLSGCCQECNNAYLGEFLLRESSLDILRATQTENPNRLFAQPGFSDQVLSYDDLLSIVDRQPFNCREQGNCGACCDEFDVQRANARLSAPGAGIQFDLSLQKDFSTQTPNESPQDVGDQLTMTMNNRLVGTFKLGESNLRDRITLNGVDYPRVFAVEADSSTFTVGTRQPTAFYLDPTRGIVGYKLANGEVWNLAN